jgi:site-specific recombinase XerD
MTRILGTFLYARVYGKVFRIQHKNSWKSDVGRLTVCSKRFGERQLDEITPLEIEQFRDSLLDTRSRATSNRYRDLLSAVFKCAVRDGLVPTNPVRTVSKFKETGGRLSWLEHEAEAAIYDVLLPELRPLFIVSVNTGLRWGEQIGLQWRDVDFLSGFITVRRSKHGRSRQVPMNSATRAALLDLGARRQRPDDPEEPVFARRYREPDKFFPKAVLLAQARLRDSGTDTSRLDGYTWHSNRHTFASRLVMVGVDLRTVQQLGGWRTLSMVHRYSHLAPGHLQAAVERIVGPVWASNVTVVDSSKLGVNLDRGAHQQARVL